MTMAKLARSENLGLKPRNFVRTAAIVDGRRIDHHEPVNRRTFLTGTAVGGAAAAAAATYLGVQRATDLPRPTAPLDVLDDVSFGVLAVVAARVLAFDGADPVRVAHGVDQSLRHATPEAQAEFRLVLGVLENALSGLLTRGHATLFSALSPEAQDLALNRWGSGAIAPLRGAAQAMRKLCLGVHYAPLSAAAAVGYPGPSLKKPRPAPIESRQPLSPPWTPPARPGSAPASDEGVTP